MCNVIEFLGAVRAGDAGYGAVHCIHTHTHTHTHTHITLLPNSENTNTQLDEKGVHLNIFYSSIKMIFVYGK